MAVEKCGTRDSGRPLGEGLEEEPTGSRFMALRRAARSTAVWLLLFLWGITGIAAFVFLPHWDDFWRFLQSRQVPVILANIALGLPLMITVIIRVFVLKSLSARNAINSFFVPVGATACILFALYFHSDMVHEEAKELALALKGYHREGGGVSPSMASGLWSVGMILLCPAVHAFGWFQAFSQRKSCSSGFGLALVHRRVSGR